jgi:rRNA maturation endonuclease Nob1
MLVCKDCGLIFNENDKMYNPKLEECPKCGGTVYTPCEYKEDWRDFVND